MLIVASGQHIYRHVLILKFRRSTFRDQCEKCFLAPAQLLLQVPVTYDFLLSQQAVKAITQSQGKGQAVLDKSLRSCCLQNWNPTQNRKHSAKRRNPSFLHNIYTCKQPYLFINIKASASSQGSVRNSTSRKYCHRRAMNLRCRGPTGQKTLSGTLLHIQIICTHWIHGSQYYTAAPAYDVSLTSRKYSMLQLPATLTRRCTKRTCIQAVPVLRSNLPRTHSHRALQWQLA